MKNEKDLAKILNAIDMQGKRTDSIEQLLKMLLVNSLLNDFEIVSNENNDIVVDVEIEDILLNKGFGLGEVEEINGQEILYVLIPTSKKTPVSTLISIHRECMVINPSLIICFYFDQINGIQRKRILEEQISFCVKNKEFHIFPN